MDPLTQLDQLGPHLGGVVAGIRPDQLDDPTPCDDFTVRGVLEHMIGGATAFAAAYRGRRAGRARPAATRSAPSAPCSATSSPPSPRPGALDQTVAAPVRRGARRDLRPLRRARRARPRLGHGRRHRPALRAARRARAAADAFAHQALDPLRDGQTFAAAVEPAPDASPIERLATYTGRH